MNGFSERGQSNRINMLENKVLHSNKFPGLAHNSLLGLVAVTRKAHVTFLAGGFRETLRFG